MQVDFVLLDFEVTEDMKKEDAENISKKFYERLEKEYPEHSIDIQARKSGETFRTRNKRSQIVNVKIPSC